MFPGILSTTSTVVSHPFRKSLQLSHSCFLTIFILLLALGSTTLCAQINDIRFDHISLADGLSQSTVYSIAQDSIGFMWFSTRDGLNKYDGYTFTIYRPDESDQNSISELGIRQLLVDNIGDLWIVTLNGLLDRFNPLTGKFYHYKIGEGNPHSEIEKKFRCIVKDKDGNIWIGTSAGEIYKYNQRNDIFIHKPFKIQSFSGSQNIHLQCIYADQFGFVWLGAWEGLIRFNCKTGEAIHFINKPEDAHSLGGNAVFGIAGDVSGNIWVATADGGVSVLNCRSLKFETYNHNIRDINSLGSNRTMSIFVDSKNNIWIGTLDAGLDYFDSEKKTFRHYRHDSALPWSISSGAVRSFYEDKNGSIWIGTAGSGISCIDWNRQNFGSIVHNENEKNSLSKNSILSIIEDKSGKLWIGTDGGGLNVGVLSENSFNHYFQTSSTLISNSITALYETKNGMIWIGSDPGIGSSAGTVIKYDPKSNQFEPQKILSPDAAGISFFYEDSKGDFWIGAYFDGLRRYNSVNKTLSHYKHDDGNNLSISENSVLCVTEDSQGYLWFGTYGAGLNKFNKKTEEFENYFSDRGSQESLNNNSIWSIYADDKDNLWIGTWGGGLNQYIRQENRFRNFTAKNGLPSNVIYGILPDKNGNLWLSTNRGICKFNMQTFDCVNYDYSDGLINSEFNQGAYCKGADGRFYFGGANGVSVFFPDSIQKNTHVPSVVLTDFKVYDKQINLNEPIYSTKEITLSYNQNFFSFEFAVLDYAAPEKNQYMYILKGLDKNWVQSGNRNYVSYTDVPPGDYIFKVQGSNSDGTWNKKEASLLVIITPPFWLTWWFRILIIIFLILLLYSFHKYRLNKLLEVERTRNRIARDLHDEVSASITGIVYFADAVKTEVGERETPALKKLINLISESATQIQESMSDIIWSINPDNDDWNIVLPKFRRYASDLCESKGIKYIIEVPENFPGKSLKMGQRHDLWLVFKEIVTNSVKHSLCTIIEIKIFTDSEYLNLNISDNGIGFDSELVSINNGLKNIRSRCKTLGGTAVLSTSINIGTKWEIRIPLNSSKSK